MEVLQLGFQILVMKLCKKDVRIQLRTSSFGFTLIEMVITLMLNAMVMTAFFQIMYYKPLVMNDTFTRDKIMIRTLKQLSCEEGFLFDKEKPLEILCTEGNALIKIYLEEKVFYVKKSNGIYFD